MNLPNLLVRGPLSVGESPAVLTCWREIAAYLGRGVRTAQRWETEFGLPVRRISQGVKSAVLAVPSEIDAWVQLQQFSSGQLDSVESGCTAMVQTVKDLRAEIQKLRSENNGLRRQLVAGKPVRAEIA